MKRDVPAWAKAAAYAAPACVLPSALWRFYFLATGPDPACVGDWRWYEPIVIASFSVVTFGASLLTLGLVSEWGEVFPRWIPVVGGRTVPVGFAVGLATLGVAVVGFLTVWPAINSYIHYFTPVIPEGCHLPTEGWVVPVVYSPVVLWAPLLAIVTWNYYQRHKGGRRVSRAVS